MKTRKLYDEAPYATHFTATIIDVAQHHKYVTLVLNQTLFFPEEGGQCADTGTIDGVQVVDVKIKDGVITHHIKAKMTDFHVGQEVTGDVDWDLRFSNMQNHSAEHILSGLVHRRYGYDNVGFHLGTSEVTVDFNGLLTEEDVRRLEHDVNQAIYENVPIIASYPDEEMLPSMDYRFKKEIDDDLRIVEVTNYDLCACCAPHVRATGEIGLLKILRCDRYKQGVRLSILAGSRAFAYLTKDFDQMAVLYRMLSANQATVLKHVTRLLEENGSLKTQLNDYQRQVMRAKVDALEGDYAFFFEPALDALIARDIINEMRAKGFTHAGIFIGDDVSGYRFTIASGKDARVFAAELRKNGGKGGGKADMVTGFMKARHPEIEEILISCMRS